MRRFDSDRLRVCIAPTRREMGEQAAAAAAALLRDLQGKKPMVQVIFAAAPSQNEMLDAFVAAPGIDWTRIMAFHMDEYLGLAPDAPQGFGNFLDAHLFSRVPFGRVFRLDGGAADAQAECARYGALLRQYPADLVCIGIGENGHIAFNDPGVARFDDPETVKVAVLDEICRLQQVHDGCFAAQDEVPRRVLTLTVPTLMRAPHLVCTVPGSAKREAVLRTVRGPVGPAVPATAMRMHPDAQLFCDADSAALLEEEEGKEKRV